MRPLGKLERNRYTFRGDNSKSNVRVAERLAPSNSDHEIPGLNFAGRDFAHDCTALHCTEPSIIMHVLPSSRYDLDYSKTCVRQPPLKLTLVVDVERWSSYKGTCHVILLAKLHDMYLYKTDNFFHINHYLKSVSKVALLHRFYCMLKGM